MSYVVGVDVGGTKTAAALVDAHGAVGPITVVPTRGDLGPARVLDMVADVIASVIATARSMHDGAAAQTIVHAIGIGTAGVVDSHTGSILSSTDVMAGWTGTDVAGGVQDRLTARLGLTMPISVDNDVDAHGAGEAWLGAAAGTESALMVAVGTGVGGAIIIGGTPWRGSRHLAGEMGHIPAPGAEGLRCGCGRMGHLEALGSGPALHRHYLALGGDAASPDTRDVVVRATGGEAIALRAVRESAEIVGRATAGVVTMIDPEVVVIGGGMAHAGPIWWEAMESALRAELIDPFGDLRVVPATLGESAAIVGAARRAWSGVHTAALLADPSQPELCTTPPNAT